MEEKRKYSGQRFFYDVDLVLKLASILADDSVNGKTNNDLSDYY